MKPDYQLARNLVDLTGHTIYGFFQTLSFSTKIEDAGKWQANIRAINRTAVKPVSNASTAATLSRRARRNKAAIFPSMDRV